MPPRAADDYTGLYAVCCFFIVTPSYMTAVAAQGIHLTMIIL